MIASIIFVKGKSFLLYSESKEVKIKTDNFYYRKMKFCFNLFIDFYWCSSTFVAIFIPPCHPRIYFFKYILLVMLLWLSHCFFSPLFPSALYPSSPSITPLTSCPWVIHINSLASPFPILFLTSPRCVPTNYASYSLYHFPYSPPIWW